MKVLIKVTGSISSYKICELVSSLVKEGHEVKVAMSKSAEKFVGSATFEALSHNEVYTDDFQPGRRLDHIYLNDWADLVVLAPATAQSLNALSNGVGSGVITTLFLSRKPETPYLIFPAMNPRMWLSPSVQNAVKNLETQRNVFIHSPSKGLMACGHEGSGRLNEPYEILSQIYKCMDFKEKVLITLGGTFESLDGVREISNFSTGKTGLELIRSLRNRYELHVLASEKTKELLKGEFGFKLDFFTGVEDLSLKMKEKLSTITYSALFHLAAVSDYISVNKASKKIDSNADEIQINLVKAPKLLNQVKSWSKNQDLKVVSFKLTHNQEEKVILEKIKNQFKASDSDFIVHNELGEISKEKHIFKIFKSDLSIVESGESKKELSQFFEGGL